MKTQNQKRKIITRLLQVALVLGSTLYLPGISQADSESLGKPPLQSEIGRRVEVDCRLLLKAAALSDEGKACIAKRETCELSLLQEVSAELGAKLEDCDEKSSGLRQVCLSEINDLDLLQAAEQNYKKELTQVCSAASPEDSAPSLVSPTVPQGPTRLNRDDNPLGPGHKIDQGKGADLKQQPVAGFAMRDGKPSAGGQLPGGIAIPMDPSARPVLSAFQMRLPANLLGQSEDTSKSNSSSSNSNTNTGSKGSSMDPRAGMDLSQFKKPGDLSGQGEDSSMGSDPFSRLMDVINRGGLSGLKDKVASFFSDKDPDSAPEGYHAPSYSAEEDKSGGGGGIIEDTKKGAQQYANTVTSSDEDNTPQGIAKRKAKEEDEFLSATTKTSKDGTITKDTLPNGTVRVRDENNGTTTTLYPDGSTQTVDNKTEKVIDTTHPSTKMPDPDHQGAPLPAVIQKQLDADKAALRAIGPKHVPGYIDFGGEGSDAGTPVGPIQNTGGVPDQKNGVTDPPSVDEQDPGHPNPDQEKPTPGPDQNVIHVL